MGRLPVTKPSLSSEYLEQAERLSGHSHRGRDGLITGSTTAVQAKFVTPQDPVIETADGSRLPSVPLFEAQKLNALKNQVDGTNAPLVDEKNKVYYPNDVTNNESRVQEQSYAHNARPEGLIMSRRSSQSSDPSATLRLAIPPSRTNPLFPPLPLYGPSSLFRDVQCMAFRVSSAILSLCFLGVIVMGAAATSLPLAYRNVTMRLRGRDPNAHRPFYMEEKRRQALRKEEVRAWRRRSSTSKSGGDDDDVADQDREYVPTEGGEDPLICDVAYYARRVGLDVEKFEVQTEDGFIIQLWHVYNPKTESRRSSEYRRHRGPQIFADANGSIDAPHDEGQGDHTRRKKYPVLLIHGLLQSAGAYCSNDDDSLAFLLCKNGYDVWLGNNRCGFDPKHTLLGYSDPRMWAWNIRQMGVMDLPALISRVLAETGFDKLGLVCHSQGTTQTLVALAKGQRPDLGHKISVFCALAPAAYAGPLIGKGYFKFMRAISSGMFRIVFGIHSFIPFMMAMHSLLPGAMYGALGYRTFSFLFNWSDDRWDQGLRNRMFQFAPVYVSAESMRWWLGRDCFAKHKCILSTKEEGKQEEAEDEDDEDDEKEGPSALTNQSPPPHATEDGKSRGARAWYDDQVPPFAMWVAGSDDLVDGRRLLRRFERGREPHVQMVHSRIIPEYEHLDVIWAMDSPVKVGKEVKEVLWKTIPQDVRNSCRVPAGCGEVKPWAPESPSG
ncbi:MAG: hypothetical protein M1817_005940 [Caeruleum heppii]|nr:MAG: hypothetical protein M1817_005940 [Caeruleum heppii]